jgi:hypothetical protein
VSAAKVQQVYQDRQLADLKAQTEAANAQKAAAEAASAQAAKVAEQAKQSSQYTSQARTQSQVQNVNAINVQSMLRNYGSQSPQQAQTDIQQVTADGADGVTSATGTEDQRKRPGGFTNRATGIRIS